MSSFQIQVSSKLLTILIKKILLINDLFENKMEKRRFIFKFYIQKN